MPPPPLALDIPAEGGAFSPVRPQRPAGAGSWRKFASFAGPGYLVAVGYMDPGNWATGLAGGSAYGYRLLSVIVIANLMAMTLQSLAAKLGIATGQDLAQACRDRYAPPVRMGLWLLCEVAIVACEVAEVVGTAIALNLLFNLPLLAGIALSTVAVFAIFALQKSGTRRLEAFIIVLITLIAGCLVAEMVFARPDIASLAAGLVPSPRILTDPAILYLAVGILGATVMPHNLYLHSAVVQERPYARTPAGRREALRFARLDTRIALSIALLINGAILVLAAAAFHRPGVAEAIGIHEAHRLLTPVLGAGAASALFGVALLAAGQNSSVTGAMAGQIVMQGFTRLRFPPFWRRLVSRGLAVIPAAVIAGSQGIEGTAQLLIFSQVVLSLQLPFAVGPLISLTSDRTRMGALANTRLEAVGYWAIAALLIALNVALLASLVHGV